MDNKTKKERSLNMSHIHSKNTKIEIEVRKYLFSKGLRYRLHDKKVKGHPDIIFPKYKTVIFVNGCFWHGHIGCKLASIPKTNIEFWKKKIDTNTNRDKVVQEELRNNGWNVIVIWQCQLSTKEKREKVLENLYNQIINK